MINLLLEYYKIMYSENNNGISTCPTTAIEVGMDIHN